MKFSILTACFNKKKYITECVSSVKEQNYNDWEHIVVDDGSDDGSYDLLLGLNHPKLKLIRNINRIYCSSSYAVALQHASGDICAIVDADDRLAPGAMQKLSKRYLIYPDVDFIYTQFFWCNERMTVRNKGFSSLPHKGHSLADMALKGKHCYSHWRTFRRQLSTRTVLFPEGLRYSVDKNLGFMLEEVGQGAFFPKITYFYRYYKKNMSLMFPSEQKATTRQLATERKKYRKKNNIRPSAIRKIH